MQYHNATCFVVMLNLTANVHIFLTLLMHIKIMHVVRVWNLTKYMAVTVYLHLSVFQKLTVLPLNDKNRTKIII